MVTSKMAMSHVALGCMYMCCMHAPRALGQGLQICLTQRFLHGAPWLCKVTAALGRIHAYTYHRKKPSSHLWPSAAIRIDVCQECRRLPGQILQ